MLFPWVPPPPTIGLLTLLCWNAFLGTSVNVGFTMSENTISPFLKIYQPERILILASKPQSQINLMPLTNDQVYQPVLVQVILPVNIIVFWTILLLWYLWKTPSALFWLKIWPFVRGNCVALRFPGKGPNSLSSQWSSKNLNKPHMLAFTNFYDTCIRTLCIRFAYRMSPRPVSRA